MKLIGGLGLVLFIGLGALAQDGAALDRETVLRQRVEQSLTPPPANADEAQVRRRLERIIDDAGQWAAAAELPGPRLTAIGVQAQSLVALLERFPGDDQAGQWLGKLRAAARKAKTVDSPAAPSAGDAWLMIAELHDLGRSDLDPADKRAQAQAALEQFIASHGESPVGRAARELLESRRTAEPEEGAANVAAPVPPPGAAPTPQESAELKPLPDEGDGVMRFELTSPHQDGPNVIRVLLPDKLRENPGRLAADDGFRFLYVLPVEPGLEHRYTDGLAEAARLGLANKHDLIVVAPSFSRLPWYADHPTDPHIAQQRYVFESLVPAVEKRFTMHDPRRLLVGFSKSGWGAVSLLLAQPDVFDAAALFDAPLMMTGWPTKYGSAPIFGTEENFRLYELAPRVRAAADMLRQHPRIALIGYGNFQEPMEQFHALLEELRIPHEYQSGDRRVHTWTSGWLEPAVQALVKMTE